MRNSEEKYLYSIIQSITYDPNRLTLYISDDKYIGGVLSPDASNDDMLSKIMAYKTVYVSIIDADNKIKFSLQKAIENTYSDEVQSKFSMFDYPKGKEWEAFYYMENAVFRLSTLWDLLAQLYRLKYLPNEKAERVYHKQFFEENKKESQFSQDATVIVDYFNEKNNTEGLDGWKGNYGYVNELRNKLTHRNAPTISIGSSFDFNIKDHPSFQLKRIVEDYNQVSLFIEEILQIIMQEIDG